MRAVILITAAVTAGLSAIAHGHLLPGLALALVGSIYILITALSAVLEQPDSPHHTAVTAGDILLITAVVWLTGGPSSEYYLLYYLPVLGAGLRLNVRDGIAASILAGVLYTFVTLARPAGPALVTSVSARVFAVCISAVVLVIFFALLKREMRLGDTLRETIHTSLGRVAAIYDVAHAANTRAEFASLLSILLDHAARVTRAANGLILLLGRDGQLTPTASLSSPPDEAASAIEFPPEPANQALANASPVTFQPDRQSPTPSPAKQRTFVYVPLKAAVSPIGVLVLASRSGRSFARSHLEFLKSLCSEAALAIENAQLRSELQRLAVTDHLTGLPNRRELERALLSELTRAQRYGRSLALLALDVDNLKAVNDQFGHAAGDELLRALGAMLQASLRATDATGRVGGDEFMVVLPETDPAQAAATADRLIADFPKHLRERPMFQASPALPALAGLSIGIAATGEGRFSTKKLVAAADGALYQAKRAGKNRSNVAPPPSDLAPAGAPAGAPARAPEQDPLTL